MPAGEPKSAISGWTPGIHSREQKRTPRALAMKIVTPDEVDLAYSI